MINRKEFLKAAGCAALAAVTGRWAAAAETASKAGRPQSAEEAARPRHERRPRASRQWGMAVDLRKCWKDEGCRDCIAACHQEHNVPDLGNPKEEVKWIWKEPFEHAFHGEGHDFEKAGLGDLPTPLLCNHCEKPACAKVCPTKATWRREEDGIVMMDWHRCIGCRYCIVACPYGSRSFNWRDPRPFIKKVRAEFPTRTRGVVEKCTFCEERLAQGKPPACVEACKAKALVFGDLSDEGSEVRKLLKSNFSLVRKPGLGTRPKVYYLAP